MRRSLAISSIFVKHDRFIGNHNDGEEEAQWRPASGRDVLLWIHGVGYVYLVVLWVGEKLLGGSRSSREQGVE